MVKRIKFDSRQKLSFSPRLFFVVLVFLVGNLFAQTPEQIKFYSERIEFGTDEVKRNALFDLRNFQTETASRIATPALKDISEVVRATATHSVLFLPKEESANVLLPLLKDKSEFVRRESAYALGRTRNSSIVNDLIRAFEKEKKQSVKDSIVVALGLTGSPVAVPTLMKVLSRKLSKKRNFSRRAAARSIGQIAESIKQKEMTFLTPQSFLPDEYKNLANTELKGFMSDFPVFREAISDLSKTLINKKEIPDVRRESAFALGAIGNEQAIQVLSLNSSSEDLYLAEICEEALVKINN